MAHPSFDWYTIHYNANNVPKFSVDKSVTNVFFHVFCNNICISVEMQLNNGSFCWTEESHKYHFPSKKITNFLNFSGLLKQLFNNFQRLQNNANKQVLTY